FAGTQVTLFFTPTIADDGKQYRAVVTNLAGSATSAPAKLRVYPACGGSAAATQIFSATGGPASATVSDSPPCTCYISTDSPNWITFTGTTSGKGPGSFGFSISPNPGPARMGTVQFQDYPTPNYLPPVPFKVMQGGSTGIFTDVTPSNPNFDYMSLLS